MIKRILQKEIEERLKHYPAVCILGPRQVGKTTLAREIVKTIPSIYLDLESVEDRAKLQNASSYLSAHTDKLVILDEVQRTPKLFESLRGLIDKARQSSNGTGNYLILGSASIDLLRQSSESLAGRISYMHLGSLNAFEISESDIHIDELWTRGGFPRSILTETDEVSMLWRRDFISTYLERDIPQLGPRIPAETLRRFWTMLAHEQGSPLNAAKIASGLAISGQTVVRYLDLMVDLLLIRKLEPWHSNTGKRLVKSPKVYVRDSGLAHTLLGIKNKDSLLGHPVIGGSWEGFIIENILDVTPQGVKASYYRSSTGDEIDLVLSINNKNYAIEIKRSSAPTVSDGFYNAIKTIKPEKSFVVYNGTEKFKISASVEAVGLIDMMMFVKGF